MLPTKYASFFKRFVAHIIDVILASTIATIIVIPLWLLNAGTGILAGISLHNFDSDFCSNPEGYISAALAGVSVVAIIFLVFIHILLYWFYFAVFESGPRQATPGKMMLGLFVSDELGRRISFSRALGRTLGKVLSKLLCWMGYIIALFTARSQALHDLLAGTLVLEPVYPAPYANTAPPNATPPGYAPAPGAVTAPEPHASPVQQSTETEPEIEKPEKNSIDKDKPEQEKE